MTGDDSPRGLASLGAIAQGAILPGMVTGGLASLGASARGAILPGVVTGGLPGLVTM